ncbi:MAG: BsuPI-related putative proteinase inhibitor [Bacillota bacterium]
MKKAFVILFFVISAACLLPETMQAGNQQPEWNVEVKQETGSVDIKLTVSNNTPDEMTLEFPSSQFFEYEVIDPAGDIIYRFSDNKAFLQAIQQITLNSGEKKVWQDRWNYSAAEGKKVPPGEYLISASLAVKGINGKPVERTIGKKVKFTIEEESPSFRNVELSFSEGVYHVKGEAKVSAGCFYYTVEDGHNILKEETLVKVNKKSPNWSSFELNFKLSEDQAGKNRPVFLNLYERDLKEGTIYHNYPVKIKESD